MKYSFPDPDGPLAPEWKAPLERMMAITAGDRRYRWLDPDDLMVMVRLLRPPRPSIVVYKHSYSRRHLNLDDSAQAYRYIPPRRGSKSQGRHDRHRSLDDALKALALYELPWMKPGLELERRGLDWDQRWTLRWLLEADELDEYGGLGEACGCCNDRRWVDDDLDFDLSGDVGADDDRALGGGDRRGRLRVV